jgi:Ca-activated chloride channel family protein
MTFLDEAPVRHAVGSRALRSFLLLLRLSLVTFPLASHVNICAQDDPDTDVVRVRTDLVTAPVFVTESHGRRIMNLVAADFELRDDGRVVKIEYFSAGTERVALVFLLDASGSSRDVISRQRKVALALLSRFGRGSEVAVIRFAEKAKIVAPFSSGLSDASLAFDLPALENYRTAIFDSVASAIRVFDARRADATERRIIILISDGLDTASATRPGDVIDAAIDRGVSVYSIQIPLYAPRDGRLRPRSASKGFRDVAEKSGGRFFMAGDAKSALADQTSYDLSPIFQAIEDDLRGQYVLGYYPDAETQDGRFHRIVINLTSKEKRRLRVHSLREGYTSTK